MTTSRLFLTGIRAEGHHGANPGEKDVAQAFVVDLDVEVEVSGDAIGATADYRGLIRTARETVERERFDLLENVADAVARAVVVGGRGRSGSRRSSTSRARRARTTSRASPPRRPSNATAERRTMAESAYLALGSNLGDRLSTLQHAVDLLSARAGIEVVRSSRVYETDPVGPPQPAYLNAVIEVRTDLEPLGLLEACRAVEAELGRVRDERWGPRTLDVDVLTYDERTVDEPDLTIPHPRMHERGFVLVPLGELDPDPMLPGGRSLAGLRLPPGAVLGVRPFAPPLRVDLMSDGREPAPGRVRRGRSLLAAVVGLGLLASLPLVFGLLGGEDRAGLASQPAGPVGEGPAPGIEGNLTGRLAYVADDPATGRPRLWVLDLEDGSVVEGPSVPDVAELHAAGPVNTWIALVGRDGSDSVGYLVRSPSATIQPAEIARGDVVSLSTDGNVLRRRRRGRRSLAGVSGALVLAPPGPAHDVSRCVRLLEAPFPADGSWPRRCSAPSSPSSA